MTKGLVLRFVPRLYAKGVQFRTPLCEKCFLRRTCRRRKRFNLFFRWVEKTLRGIIDGPGLLLPLLVLCMDSREGPGHSLIGQGPELLPAVPPVNEVIVLEGGVFQELALLVVVGYGVDLSLGIPVALGGDDGVGLF